MTRAKSFLVIGILLILTNEGQMADWLSNLNENLNNLNKRIQQSVHDLQSNVQDSVQRSLADVDRVTSRINEDVQKAIKDGKFNGQVVNGVNSQTVVSGVNSGVYVMNSPGTSRTITSGINQDGTPFWYDVEDRVVNRTLIHTERLRNNTGDGIQVVAYTIDLDDPNAKPVPFATNT